MVSFNPPIVKFVKMIPRLLSAILALKLETGPKFCDFFPQKVVSRWLELTNTVKSARRPQLTEIYNKNL